MQSYGGSGLSVLTILAFCLFTIYNKKNRFSIVFTRSGHNIKGVFCCNGGLCRPRKVQNAQPHTYILSGLPINGSALVSVSPQSRASEGAAASDVFWLKRQKPECRLEGKRLRADAWRCASGWVGVCWVIGFVRHEPCSVEGDGIKCLIKHATFTLPQCSWAAGMSRRAALGAHLKSELFPSSIHTADGHFNGNTCLINVHCRITE